MICVFSRPSSPDGRQLVTGHGIPGSEKPGQVFLWSTLTGKRLHTFPLDSRATVATFSDDGTQIVVGDQDETTLREVSTGRELHKVQIGVARGRAYINSEGKRVLVYLRTLRDVKTEAGRETVSYTHLTLPTSG